MVFDDENDTFVILDLSFSSYLYYLAYNFTKIFYNNVI